MSNHGPAAYGMGQQTGSMGSMKWVFILVSVFIPIVGIVFFLIWHNNKDPDKRYVSKMCLYISMIWISIIIILMVNST